MRGKAALVIGAAAGYVLGARAGRERYDAIKEQASTTAGRVRRDPRVRDGVAQAKDKTAEAAAQASTAASAKATQAKEKARDAAPGGDDTVGPSGAPGNHRG